MADSPVHKIPYVFDTGESAPEEEPAAERPAAEDKPAEKKTMKKRTSSAASSKRRKSVGKTRRRKKRKKKSVRFLPWVLLFVLLLAIGAGAYYVHQTYVRVGTQFVRRDAQTADLRSHSVSLEEYNAAAEKLPGARILWNVPLSGGEFSCDSTSIALSQFSDSDLEMLRYFDGLEYIDAEAADLSPEQFEALSAALPGVDIDWMVPVGGERFSADAEELKLASLTEDDISLLTYFPGLKTVDARQCRDYNAILALRDARPDLTVRWQVSFSGKEIPDDAQELLVDDPSITVAQLEEALRYLPQISIVEAPVNGWTMEEKDALCETWPEISFHWPVTICGTEYTGAETQLDFRGRTLTAADIAEIEQYGFYLPEITHVDLTDTGLSLEDAARIQKVFPDATVTYAFTLYGKPVTTEDTYLDLSGVKIGSTKELEDALPLLSKLEKVEMTDCGISDEEMDALNKRHENVRFVWTMHFGRISNIRTDDLGFVGSLDHYLAFDSQSIMKLTYCEDMVCLDLGHRIPHGMTLDFLYGMPQLQYLVLADCRATDITPIGSLKNLVYLEMILSYANDLSPIKECTSLLDLNVCFSYNTYGSKDKNYEIFTSMAGQLERLWYSSLMIDPSRYDELKKAMPNTEVHCIYATAQATGEGWRYHKRYYEMRDYLQMIYMGDYGGRQYTKIIDGKEIPLTPEFLANQRQPDWSKVRG